MKSLLLHALTGGCFALAASFAPLLAQEKGEVGSTPDIAGAKAGDVELLAGAKAGDVELLAGAKAGDVELLAGAKAGDVELLAGAKAGDVELLAGVAGKQLEAKFIPRNDRQARLLIKNLTDRPLSVRLPDSLAARPVLAQFGLSPARPNRRGANSTPQAVGVGMPGMNPMNRGNGNANPMNGNRVFFNIAPEHAVELRVDTVCLEHGKKDPRPQIAYEICRLDEVTAAPGVGEILKRLGAGSLDQRASQAAAWHLACGMSWEDLAAKRIEHLSGPSELYFTLDQLQTAQEAADKVQEPAGDSEKSVAASSSNDLR